MQYAINLACESKKAWLDAVMADFDTFLQDHADAERKASSMAMSLVAKYPDRTNIIPELIDTSIEEMEHFRDVYNIMEKRGVQLAVEIPKDLYINQLMEIVQGGSYETRFRDRLLIASVIENRGSERFKNISLALEDPELKKFYRDLWTADARHANVYVKMALQYFNEDFIFPRLQELTEIEGKVLQSMDIRPALH